MKTNLKTQVSTQVVLQSLKKKSGPLIKKLEATTIATNTDFDAAAGTLKALKALGKEATEQFNKIDEPLKAARAELKKLFEPFFSSLATIEEKVKADMKTFVEDQNRKSMKVVEDFKSGKIKKTGTVLAKQSELTVASDNASLRKLWKARAVDVSLTPREYLIPDERAILEALKAGKKVRGWELVQETSVAI